MVRGTITGRIKEIYLVKSSDVRTWKNVQGKKELIKHLDGKPLTPKQTILAKCYDCTGGYHDGRIDCQVESCALHPFMLFQEGGPRKIIKARPMTEDQKQAMKDRFARVRALKQPRLDSEAKKRMGL